MSPSCPPRPIRLVLADDHEMVLAGLKAMLKPFHSRAQVVGESLGARDVLDMVGRLRPDIVLSDVSMGDTCGLDVCRNVIQQFPECKVVLLSIHDDEQYLFQALHAGASGYLLKRIGGMDLVRQLELVHGGATAIDPMLAARAVGTGARLQSSEVWPGARRGLTHQESEVLELLVAGLSNRGVASRLVVGDETVRVHVRSICRKLDVNDRAGAISAATREGICR